MQVTTLRQAVAEKAQWNAEFHARIDARVAEENRVAAILQANPQIGVLIRKGKSVYYINWPTYREARDPADLCGA